MNDELRARIVAAFGSGSAQEVATMIGPPANRNIVAGVWYRRGLHRDRTRKHVKVASTAVHQSVGGVGCRYIEGDPHGEATVYCNAPRAHVESSYCPAHDHLCHSHAPLSKITVRYK